MANAGLLKKTAGQILAPSNFGVTTWDEYLKKLKLIGEEYPDIGGIISC
jgi:hypothetical protein